MMDNGSSSKTIVVDYSNDIVVDLDSWIEEVLHDDLMASMIYTGVDTSTAITPNHSSETVVSTTNHGTDLGEGSSDADFMQLECATSKEMMTMGTLTPGESINTILHSEDTTTVNNSTPNSNVNTSPMHNEGILSSAVKYISNIFVQSPQSQRNTDFPVYQVIPPAQRPQYQPSLQQDCKGKAVQQPTISCSLANQSNMTFGDLQNQVCYQMPSTLPLPYTGNMVNYTPTQNLQNNPALWVQIQNLNQLQQPGSSSLMSEWWQQGNINPLNLSACPVGFATPSKFSSSTAFRQYALRQIQKMKNRYFGLLLRMRYNAMELRIRAANPEDSLNYENLQFYLERIMSFLNISRVEMLPEDDEEVYVYMNVIVNFMSYYMNMPNDFSQVEPVEAMRMQNNTSPNISQRVANLDANVSNFNRNFSSRRPRRQQRQSRIPSSLNSGSFKSTQLRNPKPKTSSVIGPSPPISLCSNTTATKFPSHPLNHQPPVVNQNLNLEKMKAPIHNTNELTKPNAQQTSGSSSKLEMNVVLSQQPAAHSAFLPSSNSPAPSKQYSSRASSLSIIDGQQTKTTTNPPSQKPKAPEDQASNLAHVVKSVSSNALSSTLTETSSIEHVMDIIPNETNVMLEYNHEPFQKKRTELSPPSVYSNQFVTQELDTSSTETPMNKKAKIENKQAILEEIKEINRELVETSINVVMDDCVDDINTLAPHEGTIVKCLFKNVFCFPSFRGPHGRITSEKIPEFIILLLVPPNYPASSPRIIKSKRNVLNEPWGMLYEEMLAKFDSLLCWIPGILSLGDIARNFDASARAVTTEFMQKRGGKGFGSRYGSGEKGMNGSSACN